jgi:DHA1 family tetracycline resistance protein-like MFS transporter
MQFLAAPVLGALSDRFGRKIILLMSLLGAALDYLLMAFAPSMAWLVLGRLIAGLTGASMTVAASYISDITDPKDRAPSFGLIGAAWGLGFIAGPSLGSLLYLLGPLHPFFAAAALNFINFLFGWKILPESLPSDKRRTVPWQQMNPFHSLLRLFTFAKISPLVWIYFLIFFAGQVMPVNWTLYTELKFQWSPMEVGLSLSAFGVTIALSQAVLTRFLLPRWGEKTSVTVGLVFYAVCFGLFGFSSESWMLYATILLFALTGMATPSLQALMTREVPANEQGELQGSLVALGSLTSVLAPLLFTPVYVHFTSEKAPIYFPGAAFVMAAILATLTTALWLIKLKSLPSSAENNFSRLA